MLPPVKKCCGLNQERNLHQIKQRLQDKTALNKYGFAGFWCERQQEMHFFIGGSGLWIYGQLLSSPDVNWWTGVVWIIVMFLSAVWTLILTAPIHCRASIAETLMQRHISTNLMKKQTHPDLGWSEDIFIFGWTVPLNRLRSSCTHLHPPRLFLFSGLLQNTVMSTPVWFSVFRRSQKQI